MPVSQIEFAVRGTTLAEIVKATEDKLRDFMPTQPVEKWRVVVAIHEHADDSVWIGHATVRPIRERPPDWDDELF